MGALFMSIRKSEIIMVFVYIRNLRIYAQILFQIRGADTS